MRATDISGRTHLWLRVAAVAVIVAAAFLPSRRGAAPQAAASQEVARVASAEMLAP